MHTLILIAMLREARGVIDRLGLEADPGGDGLDLPSFTAGDISLRLIGIGASAEAVDQALRLELPADRAMRVLLVGFAGAMAPSLRAGQIVMADRVIDDHGQAVAFDPWPDIERLVEADQRGVLLSRSQPLLHRSEKVDAQRRFGAVAVDMESAAVARACKQRRLPLCVVRTISDTADQSLPPGVMDLADRLGRARPGAVLGYLLTRPWMALTLARLAGQQRRAAAALAEAVVKLLAATDSRAATSR